MRRTIYNVLKYIEVLLIVFILVGIPVVYASEVYLMFELPKILLFRGLTVSLFATHIGRTIVCPSRGFAGLGLNLKKVKIPKIVKLFLLLLVVWTILSWVFSPQKVVAFWGNYDKRFGLFTLFHFAIFFMTLLSIFRTNKKGLVKILATFVIVPVMINVVVIARQYLYNYGYTDRAIGTFGQPNFLAGFILLLIPLIIFNFVQLKHSGIRRLNQVALVLGIIVIAVTNSRIALVLCLLLFGVYIIYFLYKHPKFKKHRKTIIREVAILGVLGLVSLLAFGGRFIQDGFVDETRTLIWDSSIDLIVKSPVMGYGFDVGGYVFPSAMYGNGVGTSLSLDRAHNEVLDIALFGGLPYLMIIAGLFGYIYVVILKKFKKSKFHIYYLTILVGLTIFWLRSMAGVNGIVHYIWVTLYLALGLSDSFRKFKFKDAECNKLIDWRFLIVLLVMILVEMVMLVSVNEYKADKYYNLYTETKRVSDIEQAVTYAPHHLRYRIEYLDALVRERANFELEDVIPKYMSDQELMPAEYYFRVGKYYLFVGNKEMAKQNFRKAVEMAPVKKVYLEAFDMV